MDEAAQHERGPLPFSEIVEQIGHHRAEVVHVEVIDGADGLVLHLGVRVIDEASDFTGFEAAERDYGGQADCRGTVAGEGADLAGVAGDVLQSVDAGMAEIDIAVVVLAEEIKDCRIMAERLELADCDACGESDAGGVIEKEFPER